MAKKITKIVKLQVIGGKANPAPPVGTALGPTGINIQDFCAQFNDKSKDQIGTVLPVVISIYEDRSFSFIVKTPPAAFLIKQILGLKSASATPHTKKVGTLTQAQLTEIAMIKMPDLNANDIDAAKKIIAGTAKNMGVEVAAA